MVAVTVMAALIFGAAHPVSASSQLPWRPYAIWPPNFCSMSSGLAGRVGGNEYSFAAATASLKAGSNGVCDDHSPAPAGTFAAMPRLQFFYAPFGGWTDCRAESYLREENAQGTWYVGSSETDFGCGAVPHRLWAGSRITYGGVNYYDDRYTGEL